MLSLGIDTAPQSFCHSFIVLSMIRCSKSAQKSAVQMCQVAAVVMETTQLVLSQFTFTIVNRELNKVSVPKIISKCCELVKLCDNGPVFLDTMGLTFRMTLSDLQWLSKVFNDTKHRAVSLWQLIFLSWSVFISNLCYILILVALSTLPHTWSSPFLFLLFSICTDQL